MRPIPSIRFTPRLVRGGVAAAATVLAAAATAVAGPTQADVFRSIQNNVDHPIDGTKVLAVLAAVAGAVVLGVVVSRWKQHRKSATRRAKNGPALLLRELARTVGLRRDQVRQLRVLNARLAADGQGVQHLATLLLCPSLIRRAEGLRADPATAVAEVG